VNGTPAVDGQLITGVEPLIAQLRGKLEVRLLTADTHGKQIEIDQQLKFTAKRLKPGGREREQKADDARALGAHQVVAIMTSIWSSSTARLSADCEQVSAVKQNLPGLI
jgi:hypothetical protein